MLLKEYPSDQLTPVMAYAAIARKGSCLLESSQGQGGRRSFIGIDSAATFTAKGEDLLLSTGSECRSFTGDPYEALKRLEKQFGLPAVGFVAYDAVRAKEKIPARHPDLFQIPDFFFQFYKTSLLFDCERGTLAITAETEEEIEQLMAELLTEQKQLPVLGAKEKLDVESDLSDADYCQVVKEAQKLIQAGEIFQIVPSRTFQAKIGASPFQVYRALRQTSPAPYLFFFDFEEYAIAGASPEKIISVQDGRVESMPIAGSCAPDAPIEILLADPKEVAEHVMLVDLARNDIGSVCLPGTVQVAEFKQAHRFSHITHIVSRIVGQLDPCFTALDAFKASFPAGTLSGAPKVRAMELIDQLENSRRGLYGGAIVSLDGKGNLDSCIAIRMAFMKEGVAYVRAGGGVVLDSDPQKEADETRMKASTVIDALQLAEGSQMNFSLDHTPFSQSLLFVESHLSSIGALAGASEAK